jgi:hypothetical protein
VVATVEWHPGPARSSSPATWRRPNKHFVAFYNRSDTCEPYIKEGKGAINWTLFSRQSFAANAVGLRQRNHALRPSTFCPGSKGSLRASALNGHGPLIPFP